MTATYRTQSPTENDGGPDALVPCQPLVSMELRWSVQDHLCSCVHLEEISPTQTLISVGRRRKKSVFKMAQKKSATFHLPVRADHTCARLCLCNRKPNACGSEGNLSFSFGHIIIQSLCFSFLEKWLFWV